MTDVVEIVVFCLVTASVLATAHACITWAIARAVGAGVRTVSIGFPTVYRRRVGGTSLELGPIVLLDYVQLSGMNPLEEERGPGDFRDLDIGARITVLLGPWLCFGLLALALLPAPRAVGSFVRTYAQLMPWHDAKALWEGFFRTLPNEPLGVVVGVVLTKYVALNLLPLPSLAGGQILTELGSALWDGGERSARVVAALRLISTFVVLAVWLNITIGLVRALM